MKLKTTALFITSIGFMLCLPPAGASATNDTRKPPPHYLENCVDCHEQMVSGNPDLLYSRSASIIKDARALYQRVVYCRTKLGLGWNKSETADVVEYLRQNFYDDK